MPYLIDGYNLLYAMGVLHGRVGPTGLAKARLSLLGLLHGTYQDEAATVTVVFDAAGAPPGTPRAEEYHGIHVRFSPGNQEADDLIEEFIRHEGAPQQLTVVSDDHRIRDAARRRRCTVLGCAEYIDWLGKYRRERARPHSPGEVKPDRVSVQDTEHWLQEFADLRDSAELRELSDPPEFLEAEDE
jgi:hypothetical protein